MAAPRLVEKVQTAFFHVAAHHFFQARLVDGQNALMQVVNLFLVNVDARYVNAHFGKASAGDKADVAGAYYCDFHGVNVGALACPRPSLERLLLRRCFLLPRCNDLGGAKPRLYCIYFFHHVWNTIKPQRRA